MWQLQKSPNIFIRASDNFDDISRYVHEEVSTSIDKGRMVRGDVSLEMKELIIETFIDKSQGMYVVFYSELESNDLQITGFDGLLFRSSSCVTTGVSNTKEISSLNWAVCPNTPRVLWHHLQRHY